VVIMSGLVLGLNPESSSTFNAISRNWNGE
jgi:hypothetical protein